MKVRQGFVSNSSSSSFVISKYVLSRKQIEQIKNHMGEESFNYEDHRGYYEQKHIKEMYPTEEERREKALQSYLSDEWSITEDDNEILGYTTMDNFYMDEFLEKIGVDKEDIKWSD